jgi:hypothetical protein
MAQQQQVQSQTRERTVWDIKDMIEKERKVNGDTPLAARLIRIYTKMADKEEEEKAAFVEHTPTPYQGAGLQEALQVAPSGLERIQGIAAERQALPAEFSSGLEATQAANEQYQGVAPTTFGQQTLLQAGEGVIPALGEVGANVVSHGADVLGDFIPDVIEKPTVEAVKKAYWGVTHAEWWDDFTDAIYEGKESLKKWAGINPKQVRLASSLVNVGAMLTDSAGVSTTLKKVGTNIQISNARTIKNERIQSIGRMLEPTQEELSKVRSDLRGHTETSESGQNTWVANDEEQARWVETARVPDLKPKAAAGYNANKVLNQIGTLSDKLVLNIVEHGNPPVGTHHMMSQLELGLEDLATSPDFRSVKGDAKVLEPLLVKARQLLEESDGTTLGLLKARQDFDKWVTSINVSAFETVVDTSRKQGVKKIRDIMTSEMSRNIPDASSQALLTRQRRLYGSLGELEAKAAVQVTGILGRAAYHVKRVSGLSTPKTVPSALLTYGILSSAAALGWVQAGVTGLGAAVAGVQAAKLLTGPKARQTMGTAIRALSEVISDTKDPILRNTLKADRAMLIYYLSEQPVTEESEEQQ